MNMIGRIVFESLQHAMQWLTKIKYTASQPERMKLCIADTAAGLTTALLDCWLLPAPLVLHVLDHHPAPAAPLLAPTRQREKERSTVMPRACVATM